MLLFLLCMCMFVPSFAVQNSVFAERHFRETTLSCNYYRHANGVSDDASWESIEFAEDCEAAAEFYNYEYKGLISNEPLYNDNNFDGGCIKIDQNGGQLYYKDYDKWYWSVENGATEVNVKDYKNICVLKALTLKQRPTWARVYYEVVDGLRFGNQAYLQYWGSVECSEWFGGEAYKVKWGHPDSTAQLQRLAPKGIASRIDTAAECERAADFTLGLNDVTDVTANSRALAENDIAQGCSVLTKNNFLQYSGAPSNTHCSQTQTCFCKVQASNYDNLQNDNYRLCQLGEDNCICGFERCSKNEYCFEGKRGNLCSGAHYGEHVFPCRSCNTRCEVDVYGPCECNGNKCGAKEKCVDGTCVGDCGGQVCNDNEICDSNECVSFLEQKRTCTREWREIEDHAECMQAASLLGKNALQSSNSFWADACHFNQDENRVEMTEIGDVHSYDKICTRLCNGTERSANFDHLQTVNICRYFGCTERLASNFDTQATDDDGSCVMYPRQKSGTCADYITSIEECQKAAKALTGYAETYRGYLGAAIQLKYPRGCFRATYFYYYFNPSSESPKECGDEGRDCICAAAPLMYGCMDSNALNYNASANIDDNSCVAKVFGCTNSNALNYNASATIDDNSCVAKVFGCTDSRYAEFTATANADDGSCATLLGCTYDKAKNYNEYAGADDGSCIVYARQESGTCADRITTAKECQTAVTALTQNVADYNQAFPYSNYPPGCFQYKGVHDYYFNTDSQSDKNCGRDGHACICRAPLIYGCTDARYAEFNATANVNDTSCATLLGCTNDKAMNFNADAVEDDGSCSMYARQESGTCANKITSADECQTAVTALTQEGEYGYNSYTANSIYPIGCFQFEGKWSYYFNRAWYSTTQCGHNGHACICRTPLIYGCTDSRYAEFTATANVNDTSCATLLGCTNDKAMNFNADAGADDGSCSMYARQGSGTCANYIQTSTECQQAAKSLELPFKFANTWHGEPKGCIIYSNQVYLNELNNSVACGVGSNDCICRAPLINGCTDFNAFNYNPDANIDDGSCVCETCKTPSDSGDVKAFVTDAIANGQTQAVLEGWSCTSLDNTSSGGNVAGDGCAICPNSSNSENVKNFVAAAKGAGQAQAVLEALSAAQSCGA